MDPQVLYFFRQELEKGAGVVTNMATAPFKLIGKGVTKGTTGAINTAGKALTEAAGGPVKGVLLGTGVLYGAKKGVQHAGKTYKSTRFATPSAPAKLKAELPQL